MPAKANLTGTAQITTTPREIDFVTRFAQNWDALMQIMGIMRPIEKTPGTKLVASKASIVLQDGNVGEGEEIPYSQAKVEPVYFDDIKIEKYAKAVSIEAVEKYGAAVAVQKTDDAFLYQLQNKVLTTFYDFLKTGTLTATETTWQRALAMSKGAVLNKFQNMQLTATEVVAFVNILDYYDYLGDKDITIQTVAGLNYVQDFLGYRTVFLLSDNFIDRGMVIAVPVENIDLYYIDPSNSDFAQLGLNYTVEGVTNLIGFHADGNYTTAVGESFALMGMKLWVEYLDGIAVYTVSDGGDDPDPTPDLGTLTVTSEAGTAPGDTKITVTPAKAEGNIYKYKVADTATDVTYDMNVQNWAVWDGIADITAATDKMITVVEATADYKARAAGSATVVSKA